MTEERKDYTVQYEIGNGYYCGCCRHTMEDEEDYEDITLNELVERIASRVAAGEDTDVNWIREHSPDIYVGEVYTQISNRTKVIKSELKQKEAEEKERKYQEQKALLDKMKAKTDLKKYVELKEKYEGVKIDEKDIPNLDSGVITDSEFLGTTE